VKYICAPVSFCIVALGCVA